jgi:hypothetical protein
MRQLSVSLVGAEPILLRIAGQLRCGVALFILVLIAAAGVSASDVYLAQSSAGSANGADCADARSVSGASWSAGNTYHLCGTITSQVTPTANGSASSHITILFEANAKISMPAIPDYAGGGGINLAGRQFIDIDGGSNGIIESIANGTSKTSHVNSVGINVDSTNNVTIHNIVFQNLFVNLCCSDGSQFGQGIYGQGAISNLRFYNNTCTQLFACVQLQETATATNVEVDHNSLPNQDVGWGIVVVMGNPGFSVTGVYIHDNDITPGSGTGINSNSATFVGTNSWCTGTSDLTHLDPIHTWSQGSSPDGVYNEYIYNNYIHGYFCVNQGVANSTAAIFWEAHVTGGNAPNTATVFNNLILMQGGHPGDGAIFPQNGTNGNIYNNTIDCTGADLGSLATEFGGGTDSYYNNLIIGCNEAVLFDGGSYSGDYNDWFNIGGAGWGQQSFAQWKSSQPGQDAHSMTSNPKINSDHTLQAGSPVIGVGSNLTSNNITQLDTSKPLNVGVGYLSTLGIPRSSSSGWDLGAYAFNGTRPNPPTALTILSVQ